MQSQGGDVKDSHLKIFVVVAAMALLIPTGAIAKRSHDKPVKGNKHGKAQKPGKAEKPGKAKTLEVKLATANVKGVVSANDETTLTLTVDKASGHAKACKGLELTFDVSEARFHTADNDADGDMDAADVLGHAVKVRAKVVLTKGRKTTCSLSEGLVLPAKAVHNRSTPPVEETDVEETEVEETEVEETEED
jgi:hypothetical protein